MKSENPVFGSKPKNRFYFLATGLEFTLSFSSWKLHKNYQMSDRINLHICLMSSVYNSFHQTVKYDPQRRHILQDYLGLKFKFI